MEENTTKTILIVEDEAGQAHALQLKLEAAGFDVMLATNGEEGLALALSEHPDLIILDLLMPKMGGKRVLESLHADDAWGKQANIVILTNFTEKAEELHDYGHPYYVKSDMRLDEIVEKVKLTLK